MSNTSRRGFLVSLLACACTSSLLTNIDLLAQAPVEDRYTVIVRLARAIVDDNFEHTVFGQMSGLLSDLGFPTEAAAPKSVELLERLLAIVPTDGIVLSSDELQMLYSGEVDPEWGMLDERLLNNMVDRLVPFAVLDELWCRSMINAPRQVNGVIAPFALTQQFDQFNRRVHTELGASTRPVPALSAMLRYGLRMVDKAQ